MLYHSLARRSPPADFRAATLAGQAPDGGLYYPAAIPRFAAGLLENLPGLAEADIAYQVMRPYVGDTIAEARPAPHLRRNGGFCLSAGAHYRARISGRWSCFTGPRWRLRTWARGL